MQRDGPVQIAPISKDQRLIAEGARQPVCVAQLTAASLLLPEQRHRLIEVAEVLEDGGQVAEGAGQVQRVPVPPVLIDQEPAQPDCFRGMACIVQEGCQLPGVAGILVRRSDGGPVGFDHAQR